MAENQNSESFERNQNSSWVLRSKYSHTVCYRLDSLTKSSFPITRSSLGQEAHRMESKPTSSGPIKPPPCPVPAPPKAAVKRSSPSKSRITEFISPKKSFSKRHPSPEPQTTVPETFKEARLRSKRFSSPQRKVSDSLLHKSPVWTRYYRGRKVTDTLPYTSPSPTSFSSPVFGDSLSPLKSPDFIGKDFKHGASWSKYIQQPGGVLTAVETAQDWMVDLSKLFLGQKFASGAHSTLYHGIYNEKPVAVKVIRQPDGEENEDMAICLEKQFNREVTILSHLHHRNIVQLVAACRRPQVFCVITEYLSGGSLRSFLHKREHGSVPLKVLVSIALDIARGMEYLHSQGVIHRDLKSENLLFNEDMCLKVVDFGIACEEVYCDYLTEDPGTYRWMAPEIISHKAYNRKIDIYSFGIVLWEIVTGRIPYEDMTPVQAAFAVVHKNARPKIPADCPPALQKLIERCWAHNPEKRPEFWEIVKILEQFEASLLHDGTLNLCQNPHSSEHRHRLACWFHRFGIGNPANATRSPSPSNR